MLFCQLFQPIAKKACTGVKERNTRTFSWEGNERKTEIFLHMIDWHTVTIILNCDGRMGTEAP